MRDDKYVVFKMADWNFFLETIDGDITETYAARNRLLRQRLDDATVIRGQDVLAPHALLAYAEAAKAHDLYDIADVFYRRAVEAEENENRKEPD